MHERNILEHNAVKHARCKEHSKHMSWKHVYGELQHLKMKIIHFAKVWVFEDKLDIRA